MRDGLYYILSMIHLEFNSTFEIDKTWDKL